LKIVEKWVRTSEELPKGFMMFQTVQLPIEKQSVLIAISMIVCNAIDDMDARVVLQGLKVAEALAGKNH
jgi:hypothetical protein